MTYGLKIAPNPRATVTMREGNVNNIQLTEDEITELRGVAKGADIWGYANASRLRSIQKKAPELIDIVPAMDKSPGHMQRPYFGCIATAAGREYLRTVSRRKRK
jgi:hypothetical protein